MDAETILYSAIGRLYTFNAQHQSCTTLNAGNSAQHQVQDCTQGLTISIWPLKQGFVIGDGFKLTLAQQDTAGCGVAGLYLCARIMGASEEATCSNFTAKFWA
jgi:hypothetical protein